MSLLFILATLLVTILTILVIALHIYILVFDESPYEDAQEPKLIEKAEFDFENTPYRAYGWRESLKK